jgi:hypothetical protein
VIKGYLSKIGTNTSTICWKEWIEKVQLLPLMETTTIPNLSLIKNKTAVQCRAEQHQYEE